MLIAPPGYGAPPAREAQGLSLAWQALDMDPDFVVREVRTPPSAWPGGPLPVTVTACNEGAEGASAAMEIVLSSDPMVSENDAIIFNMYLGWLQPSQCVTDTYYLMASVPSGAWYVGVIIDRYNNTVESDETNNTRTGPLMGIGWGPDIVISEVGVPASVMPGQMFTARVRSCNQGNQPLPAGAQVMLVLSEDPDIRFSYDGPPQDQDLPVMSFQTVPLGVGQCKTQQVSLGAQPPHEGAWYLGAVADPHHYHPELLTTNNTRASELFGIGYQPDYRIESVIGPPSVTVGQLFTVAVQTCNRGPTDSGGTDVQLVLSEDSTIVFDPGLPPAQQDQPLSSFHTGPLAPGQCRTRQVQASAQVQQQGAWYLGAVADPNRTKPELIESNNTLASDVMGIGYDADYVIREVRGPASVMPGQPFTVSVQLCNQGTGGDGTQAALVLSKDTDIDFSYSGPPSGQDLLLAFFHVAPLLPGQCRTQQVQAAAWPQSYGAWYLGAVADPGESEPELIETNNTGVSEPIGIGHDSDFTIESVSAPPSIMPGQIVMVSVETCNHGTASGSTNVQLVLSEDTDIHFSYNNPSNEDLPLVSFWSEMLAAGQCRTHQVQVPVNPPHFGGWYLGAIANPDHMAPELIETNNTGVSALTGIGYDADYIIREVRGPASVMPGQPFTASVDVCNQGNMSGHVDVMLVLSEDTDIRFSYEGPPYDQDLPLNGFFVQLAPGQCRTQQVQATAWAPQEGAWYLGAIADPGRNQPELIESNNTRASRPMGIGYRSDHVIQSVSAPASVTPGQQFTASVETCNFGTVISGTQVQLVLSEDTDIRFSYSGPPGSQDLPVGSFFVSPLEPGRCRTQQVQLSAWAPHDGAWYLGAVADPGNSEQEFLEDNNTGSSDPMGIGFQPDYSIRAVRTPASVTPGQQFTVSVETCNFGTMMGGTEVQVVLSEDADIRFSYNNPPYDQDLPLANFFTGPLAPGQCTTQQVQASAWAPEHGSWHVGAVADPGNSQQEFLETNNARASKPMGIGFKPDLEIQAVSGPASITPGQQFTASITACNNGTLPAQVEVVLVLSEDTDIRFSYSGPYEDDIPLASVYVPGPLAPGQCTTQQVQVSAWAPHDGTWYLGAVADPGNSEQEFFEDNNTLASDPMGIGFQPDYSIQLVSGPASVTPGAPITASVRSCNRGTVHGNAQLVLVLSEDTDIRFSYSTPPHEQDLPVAHFNTGPLGAGQCRTQQVEFSAWAPHDGAWYLGVVADPGNSEPEFLETNNTGVSEAVGIGFHSDFRIQSVSGPPSATPGAPVTVDVIACNVGTVPGSTDVQVVLSEDTEIGSGYSPPPYQGDIPLGAFPTGMLGPGQCMTHQVQSSASVPHEGIWYFGAAADPGNFEPEFLETNNTGVSEAVGIGFHTDFRIQAVSGPPSAKPGEPFTVDLTVCNFGTTDGATQVMLVLSEDTDIRFSYQGPPSQDLPLHSFFTGPLPAGQCTTQQLQTHALPPHPGAWYLGAVADPGNSEQEFFEDNNTRAGSLMGIGYDADIVIQELTAPSVTMGQPYEVTVTACNQGEASSPADVQLVLSEDSDIRFSYSGPPGQQDLPVEFLSFSNLDPGQCVTQNVTLSATLPGASSWHVGAVADPGQYLPELIKTNNTRASGVIHL